MRTGTFFLLLGCVAMPFLPYEPVQKWTKGTTDELSEVRSLLNATNTPVIRVVWWASDIHKYKRVLSTNEVNEVLSALSDLHLVDQKEGTVNTEPVIGKLLIACRDKEETLMEIAVARNQRVFVAIHRRGDFQIDMRCFTGSRWPGLVRELIRQPGAVKIEPTLPLVDPKLLNQGSPQ